MERIFALFLALLMFLAVFTACGGETADTGSGESAESDNPGTEISAEDERRAIADIVPKDLKYPDETVTFLCRTTLEYELSVEELVNDILQDAIHYRNIDVENRLGISMKTVTMDGAYKEYPKFNEALRTSVLTNTGDYDGAAIYTSQGSALAKEGIYMNLYTISDAYGDGYLDFAKPWWNQALVNELTVYDALYMVMGDATISATSNGECLFFNKRLFEENYPDVRAEGLYQCVRDGKWVIDKLIEYADGVWTDVNSDGIPNDGDVLGWKGNANQDDGGQDVWLYALGLQITEMDEYGEPKISLAYDPDTIPAYEKVKKLYRGTRGSYNGESSLTLMANDNQLFGRYTFAGGESLRSSTVNYGVLPLPKLNEEQEAYRTTPLNGSSSLIVCSNLSDARAKMLSAYLEVLAAESYKQVTPVYYSKVLQGVYSKDQPDAEMYDIILKSFVIDFGFVYSSVSINGIGSIFRKVDDSYDIAATIESKKNSWETSLNSLLQGLSDVG